jgi:peptidoglycan/LPS O-acetylase OafA/YrhL
VLGFENDLWHWIGFGVILLLTISAAFLVLGFHLQARALSRWSLKGTGWLQSFGRLSYEIYLTHMFVVLSVVRIFKVSHSSIRWGFLWYLPTLILSWALGWLVAKYFSIPCEKAMRRGLTKTKPLHEVEPLSQEA